MLSQKFRISLRPKIHRFSAAQTILYHLLILTGSFNDLIDHSIELILSKEALVTSSISIISPAKNISINVFSNRARRFYLPALLFHLKRQISPNSAEYKVVPKK